MKIDYDCVIPRCNRRRDVEEVITSFVSSGREYAEVIDDEGRYAYPDCMYGSFKNANQKLGRPVRLSLRGGRLFLLKKEDNNG